MGRSFTPSFKGSPSLFVTVGLSPFAFCFFVFLLVADLSSTLSDDSVEIVPKKGKNDEGDKQE